MDIYKEALFNGHKDNRQKLNFNCIRAQNGQIYSINFTKAGVSNSDDKRYYHSNLYSLPYGHWRNQN